MMKIGITGGIGSGKTTVCKIFKQLGFPVFNSDIEAKNLMVSDKQLVADLKEAFGHDVYFDNGELNKKMLAQIIFNDKEALKTVNSLVHPAVKRHFERWCKRKKRYNQYLIKEAAILIESGTYKDMDAVVMVYTPVEERIERVSKRTGENRDTVIARMKNQMSDEKKIDIAGFVINNADNQLVVPQILKLIHFNFDTKKLKKNVWEN